MSFQLSSLNGSLSSMEMSMANGTGKTLQQISNNLNVTLEDIPGYLDLSIRVFVVDAIWAAGWLLEMGVANFILHRRANHIKICEEDALDDKDLGDNKRILEESPIDVAHLEKYLSPRGWTLQDNKWSPSSMDIHIKAS